MRYLKRFNESVYGDRDRLKEIEEERLTKEDVFELSRDYLSYLIDQGYKVEVDKRGGFDIDITLNYNSTDDGLTSMDWDSIKEDVLPFIEILEKGALGLVLCKVVMYRINDGFRNISFEVSTLKDYDKFMTKIAEENIKTMHCLSIEVEDAFYN